MSKSEPTGPEGLDPFWKHVKQVSEEVRGWPEWKKAFACEIFSFPRSTFDGSPELRTSSEDES